MFGDYGTISTGDARTALRGLESGSVHCCITSPPYWGLRDYEMKGQIGLEATPSEYVANLVQVFREVYRVLNDRGLLWLNLDDTYIGYHGNTKTADGSSSGDKPGYRENMRETTVGVDGLKNKELAGIPWRVAFALQDEGWYLRCDAVWSKANAKPEPKVTDRPYRAHEYVFLLTKRPRYEYDFDAVMEQAVSQPGKRGWRSVWSQPTNTRRGAGVHFAVFPESLVTPCLRAGCPVGGTVLDPFWGTGTVGSVAVQNDRRFIGVDLNPNYVRLSQQLITEDISQHETRQLSLLDLGAA